MVVAVAPALFGLEPAELPRVVSATLADSEAVPLVAKPSARERVYATAATIATERSIAATVEREVRRDDAPAVPQIAARRAIAEREADLGVSLNVGQRQAVLGVTGSGRGVDLIVGVAGAGKTTALSAVREAFEAEGYAVIGTSTSGQAARTLGRQAGVEPSRTLASLCWRLDHGQLALTDRHVVMCDEAAMTDDAALLRLLDAASAVRAKVVLVGDHRQLGAVGPGGGFEALTARYGDAVHVLADNVRQHDVAERAALAQLRDGDVAAAVAWYAANGRIVTEPDRTGALAATVAGWASDVAEGRQAQMYAWRRANVAELNRLGREAWRALGGLGDEELVAPGGARYAVGDRVVTLAPGAGGRVVTSETGTVAAIDATTTSLTVRMDDDGALHSLGPDEIGATSLAHAYAITVHRSQGSTVERAHGLDDGGGRELAYVKMSRARERSTVYVVADSPEQAAEDLSREWATERRLTWVTETEVPVREPAAPAPVVHSHRLDLASQRQRLLAERRAIIAAIPPDPTDAIMAAQMEYACLHHEREDLVAGRGRDANTAIGEVVREVELAERTMADLRRRLASDHPTRRDRRRLEADLGGWADRRSSALQRIDTLSAPEHQRLDQAELRVRARRSALETQRDKRKAWIRQHDVRHRLQVIDAGLQRLDDAMGVAHEPPPSAGRDIEPPWYRQPQVPERTLGIELGL
ncbi:MAG: AAA family ATPase [Acidimicrobiales bacterium]